MKIKDEFIPVKPPNKPIKEIRFDIWYQPKHTEEEKRQVTIDYNDCLFRHQDKNPHESCKYIQVREEDQVRFDIKYYCYETEKNKPSPFNKNLKVWLYDKEGNILTEDYLRCDRYLDKSGTCHKHIAPSLNFYLPLSES